ncbi:uncharacterized protein LOC129601754 [Paramacrobiotus metropolitanus]|uniref:uncharacterized protein LOC129601754 n=1 Tax=Paramacrobiotus metropolitanus TaxID=2943436 RepID=UPI002445ABE1|nr:uncharacterized protein LOC129601754 [Paramacrobiotus metropolitanus]
MWPLSMVASLYLGLSTLVLLINFHECLIEVYVYLKAAAPAAGCSADDLDLATLVESGNRWVDSVLLVDDQPCPQRENVTDDGDGIGAKILNAYEKYYTGIIVYLSPDKNFTTEPFSVEIPRSVVDRTNLTVHFVGYEEGVELKKFIFSSLPSTRYELRIGKNLTRLPTNESFDSFSSLLANFLHGGNSHGYSSYSTKADNSQTFNQTVALAVAVSVLVFSLLMYAIHRCCRQRKLRATRSATERAQCPSQEEAFPIAAIREELVKRHIELLIAQNEAPELEHPHATGVPLTEDEMNHLTQAEVTQQSDDMICPMCQQNLATGEMMITLPCQHIGHKECLTTWLITYSRNCPVCRQSVGAEPVTETTGADP